jgi:hypothetical protein
MQAKKRAVQQQQQRLASNRGARQASVQAVKPLQRVVDRTKALRAMVARLSEPGE